MTSFYGSVNGGQGSGGGEGIDTSTLMQKNNPTFNGTITGPNARFTGTVQIPEPTEDNHAATKGYVDAALADVDLSEVTTKMDAIETAQDELAAQLDDKADAENPAFTGTATLNGKNIATVDQIPNISDLPYLDENNPTYTGTLTGADATFSGVVSVPAPTQDRQAVNKQYVDQAIAGVQPEVDLSEVKADITELQTGKLDKANPTYTGSLTGENAAFSGTVTVATPAAEGEAANKGYVDAAKIELEGDINTLQQTVANQAEIINTLNQQVTNITGGTAELPYLKNTGDSGTGVYDFTGATVNATDPVDNGNVATKRYVDQKVASAGGTGEIVSYTQGDGISISPENEISLSIDSAGANGLKVGANGLGLDLATGTTSGAMAASDKIAIASNTTEITNIKDGTTELPYLKETNPTYEGTLIGGDATFTGSVQISTPDQDNEAANKGYVDTALAEAKSYTDNAVSGIASDETIQQIQSDIENIENGTTVLPYLSSAGGTVTGPIKYGTSPKDTSDLANKAYVDAIHVQAVADAKNYTDSEITNLENGTTKLPYIKNNGDTITGSYDLTGAAVTIAEPVSDNSPATKKYVDDSISAIDIAPLTQRVTAAEGEIDTLQTDVEAVETSVTNITNGTTELPYVKDSGDTVTGTYNFTGASVTIAEPTVSNNPATKNYVDTKIASAGGSGEVVSYTQGNGINISPENIISVVIAADNANGLAVDTSGIKLSVATSTTAGAMSAVDKAKLDASSTTEQMNQAISSAIDETLEDPTKLPFVNINGDTMHGSLTTTELFTDFVTIRNAGTDGSTGFQNNSDTDHIRVYDKVANTLVPIEVGEPVNNQDASTKKYVDDKITTETAARAEAIESLDEAKADKDNPTFTGIISGANATLSGTLTGNTASFSGGITVPLAPGAEGSATSKKYVDDQIAAINISEQIEPLTQRVTTAEGEIDTLQSDMTTVKSNVETINTNITNITNGTTKLPYVTKEEVEIAADTRDIARAYRYTFNESLGGTNSNAGFGFINFTPAIVTEKDGSTDFSPLYIGEPEKDSQAATKKYVDDTIAAVNAPEYTLAKQAAAEDGYFATYYLTKDNVQVGEKINIPKDYLVKEAELLEVAVTDTPYSGAVIGDKYIDFTINTQASDEDEQHIYLPVKDLVDVYTGGNGININASNIVSVQIDAANSNGLALGSAGLKLNLATTSTAGAMSAADKTKLDTAISEEQLTAVENKVDTLQTEVNNIKSGTTDLGYLKATDPIYTGTLKGVNATFTGDVIVPTPDGDTEAANKQYVDSAIDTTETTLREDISEVQQSVMQQTGTIDILSQTLSAITQGTMALPYVKKAGDTMSGELIVDTGGSAESPNVVTKISGGQVAFGDSAAADYALTIGFNEGNDYPSIDFNDGGAIHIKPETVTSLGVTTDTGYANVRLADPVEDNDAATKRYVDEGGNNPAGLMSVPGAVLRSDGEIALEPIEIDDSTPGININSFTLYGISTTNNPENLINPDIFEDGYYDSSGSKLTDTNGLSFSFDVQDGINTYYVSYSGTLKQDIASYSYAITEVLSTGDVYGTRGDSGAVPDTITIANTGEQPAKTSKIIVSIYGTNFSTVQNEVAIAITLGNLQIGTDYMLSPDHPKDIAGIKTSENNQIAYLNISQSDNSIDNPLTEYLSYLNITNELHGFFSAVYINRSADFDLNGFDCFYEDTAPLNIFDTYIVFCADKYTYKTNKYTKNIGSITINGDNASSLLSVAQLPTFTRGGAGGLTLTPATSLNVIKINVEDCVAGKIFTSINAPLFNHVDRASIASGMSIRNKQYIVSTHFSPIRIDDIKNVSIYQTPLNDNTIFYGWSFTETPVDIESFESNFQFDGSICFYSSKITTVEQAISYFTSNPLTVKYVLKEPETYNIPTEDYFSYKSIDRILDGGNTIGVVNVPMVSGEPDLSGDLMPVPFSIKYYNDYQKRIDYIYSAIYSLPTQSDVDKAKEKREQITSWSDDGYTFSDSNLMDYNTLYIFDKTTAIPTLTIESYVVPADPTFVYTHHFIFRSGAIPTVLTLPPEVILPDGFEIEANRIYEINIMEDLLSYQSWPVE